MNIAEVMGLWDSFITLTNTISQEGWGGRTRTAICLPLLLCKTDSWTFYSTWLLIHLYLPLLDPCCCCKWASIFRHHDSASSVRSRQELRPRGCRNLGKCVRCDSDDSGTFLPCCSHTNLPVFDAVLQPDKNQSLSRWSCSPHKSLPALWTGMQIFVIMQVAGFKREEGQRGKREWKQWRRKRKVRRLPSICSICLSSVCMQLRSTSFSLHTGSVMHCEFIQLSLISCIEKATTGPRLNALHWWFRLERKTTPSCVQRQDCVDTILQHLVFSDATCL